MDVSAEFDCAVGEMDWGEVLSTLQEVVGDLLDDSPNPPPPAPPAPVPAGRVGFDSHPQPGDSVSGGHGGHVHLGEAPDTVEQQRPLTAAPGVNAGQAAPTACQSQSCHLCSQAGADSQGQYLSYQWPVVGVPRDPAAPPHPYNQVPVVRLTNGQILLPVGTLNGEVVYDIAVDVFAPTNPAAPPPNPFVSNRRRREAQQHDGRQYVKKPPNAFMLFLKEQRPNVVAGLNFNDSALVNAVLGQRWTSLSKEEQAKYYQEADRERWLHAQKYPGWSPTDNYGIKRKRNRSKAATSVEASASKPGEVKKLCLTSVMEPPHTQTSPMQLPHAQTAVPLPVCDICHLPQVYLLFLQDSQTSAASRALDSPSALNRNTDDGAA